MYQTDHFSFQENNKFEKQKQIPLNRRHYLKYGSFPSHVIDLLTGIEMQHLSLVYLHLMVASKIVKSRHYNASPECYGSNLVTSGKDILGTA